jgi:uncharacterized YkwD family protein
MNKKLSAIALSALLIISGGCAQNDQQSKQNQQKNSQAQQSQQNKRTQNTQQKKALGGVESSISQMGNIEKVRIISNRANVKTGVSNDTPTITTQNRNSTLNVISQVGDWFAVKLPNNKIGFVSQEDCKPIVVEDETPAPPASPQQATPQETTQGGAQGGTTPKTPSANTNTASLSDAEQQMLKLVNEARAQNNVPPLKIDTELSNVARTKAQDMIDNNYFSHNSPKYGSPFDMMKSFGIKYVQAGENIAGNQSVENAHNSLMNSPGHRKNILNPEYTHIGIGIRKGGPYGNMFTQMFISKPQ